MMEHNARTMPGRISMTNVEMIPDATTRMDRHRLADEALTKILDEPDCGPGARLPTERALAESLNLPRSAVRAAFSRLEARGRVRRVIGSGTFVTREDAGDGEPASGQDASPQEIMQARLLIEPELAPLVVAHANAADLQRISKVARRAEDAKEFEEFEVWDGAFHQAIADATHNRLMADLYRAITVTRERAVWGELKRRSITVERRRHYEGQHRMILAAFGRRDAESAKDSLRSHLVEVRRNLLGF